MVDLFVIEIYTHSSPIRYQLKVHYSFEFSPYINSYERDGAEPLVKFLGHEEQVKQKHQPLFHGPDALPESFIESIIQQLLADSNI